MSKSHLTIRSVLVLILSISMFIVNVSAQGVNYETISVEGKQYYKYSVKPGEGLYAIARAFSVSVADILRSNPSASSGLTSGQELLIPVAGNTNQSAQQGVGGRASQGSGKRPPAGGDQNTTFKHTVVSGETVYSISKMYNTTVDEIYRLNPSAKESISIGQVLTIPQRRVISNEKEENYRYHTIQPKETLYSVSRTYSLKPEDIVAANPGLSVETFQIGKTIRVPFFESYEVVVPFEQQSSEIIHKVSAGETLYSISRRYGVDIKQIEGKNPMLAGGLKPNMELIIPVSNRDLQGVTARLESEANRLLLNRRPSEKVDIIKVGLLLPFLDETGGANLRLQEYYEGFALAVLEMKNRGVDLELYVFEIGKGNDTKKLESLLQTLEMQSLDLVIGGVNDAQIKVLSDFSKSRNIKYVVPFSQSNGEVLNNSNIFQVNPSPKWLIDKTSRNFIQTFRNSNIIFVSGGKNEKKDFVNQLQADLRKEGVKFETIAVSSDLDTSISNVLSTSKENVIVPTTGASATLKQILEELGQLHEANTGLRTRLFGYPEWQTYNELISDYHKYGTYIYSSFFVDGKSQSVSAFRDNFRRWYGRDLIDTNPSYGLWGYDTGLFFITAIDRYGKGFEQNVGSVNVNSLQFPFHFERLNNWGGFFNTGLYFIYYDTNGSITKMDKSR
ncbi:MAG: LysM peptidoglycan-binding domain-containing protein [Fermentimonas sp.]